MRIAVDAMGGDHAPEVVVQGAMEATLEWGMDIILVGHRHSLEEILKNYPTLPQVYLHHCEERIDMHEAPLKAVRQKKDSSIQVAFDLVKKGEADAVVSAGNSGATLVSAILTLGKLDGIERPAFASILPAEKGDVLLLDVGANVDCRPAHLYQFGVMAQAFSVSCLGMDDPKIGLLSIGEEAGKGNGQVKQAFELFRKSSLNFVGNVEGRDILTGAVQIIVCDGFVGNVVLKLSESLFEMMIRMLTGPMMHSFSGRIGSYLGKDRFREFSRDLDYAEYGGAPILGIKGVSIVCHGGSSPKAIKNAVRMAEGYSRKTYHDLLASYFNQTAGK